jgi:quinoprotein glucose dehydrogenase
MSPKAAFLALFPCALLLAPARLPAADRDWNEYLGGPDRSHYSTLDQISAANVGTLKKAWEFHSGTFGQMQCNPLVIDGVLFGATGTSGIFALDAATGKALWRFTVPGVLDPVLANDRGVTYWTDGKSARILCTVGSYLYALDALTGLPIKDFGTDGKVSLKAGLGPQAQEKFVCSTTPGTLFGDLIVMPTRVSEDQDAAPGWIQAFNVRTGTVAWVFITIPYPGEPGYETWPKDAYRNTTVGSANCWAGMAIDRKRGILYAATGSAAPDFWGGHRLGDDLYANCLLALDAATGKLLWYRQTIHHDMWDKDLPSPPVLVTLKHNGQMVDSVAQTTKTGFVFVFDRVTGESLFPIEEKPFPASTLDGEMASPTQPVPTLPKPYARQTLTEADVSPYAENRDELLAVFRAARKGLFQPFGKDNVILLPGFDGGAEWGGPGVDPEGILYVNSTNMAWLTSISDAPKESDLAKMSAGQRRYSMYCITCHGPERKGLPAGGIPSLVDVGARLHRDEIVSLIATGRKMMPGFTTLSKDDREAIAGFLLGDNAPPDAGGPAAASDAPPRIPYQFNGYNRWLDSKGYPAIAPPWGTLSAIDLNTGQYLWNVPLGEFKELTAKGIPQTGSENYGGPVVTAGNLLFIAATKDSMFRAFDKRTGTVLWETELPACGFATPSTYDVNGRQFVVIACGGSKVGTPAGDSYVAFALPYVAFTNP